MKNQIKILLVIAALIFRCANVYSQSASTWVSPFYLWTVEKWTPKADAPFATQESLLQKASQPQLSSIASKQLAVTPQPVEIYRMGLAGYLLRMKYKDSKGEAAMQKAFNAMQQIKPSQSYHFTRLRFLLTARRGRYQELRAVGVRLAQRTPKDYDVRYLLVNLLRPEMSPQDKTLAFQLVEEMEKIQPNRPSLQSIQGGVYYRLWLKNRDKNNRQLSLTKYKRFLQLAPPDDSFRPQAQRIIAQLEKA